MARSIAILQDLHGDGHEADESTANTAEHDLSDAPKESEGNNWAVIGAASAFLFVGVGYSNSYGVFQDYYQKHLFPDIAKDRIILIGSIAASLYFILAAITGRLTDLMGYRVCLILGTVLMTGSLFAASVLTQYYQLLLSQGVMFGIGVAFVYPPATTISRQYFPHKHGLANGIVVSGGALGGRILPYTVRKMIATYGLPSTFRILAYLSIALLTPSIVLLRPKHKPEPEPSSSHRPPMIDLSLLRDGRFLCLPIGCTIAMTGILPRYFLITSSSSAIVNGISPTYAAWLLGMMNGLSILGRVGIGCFADRFGAIRALTASFILCGLGHFVFWLPGVTVAVDGNGVPTASFTFFVVYIGLFGSGFISLFAVVVSHLFGSDALASKTGLLNTAIGISVLAGPSAVYAIVDSGVTKSWTIGVLTSGLFLFIGGLVLLVATTAMQKRGHGEGDHS